MVNLIFRRKKLFWWQNNNLLYYLIKIISKITKIIIRMFNINFKLFSHTLVLQSYRIRVLMSTAAAAHITWWHLSSYCIFCYNFYQSFEVIMVTLFISNSWNRLFLMTKQSRTVSYFIVTKCNYCFSNSRPTARNILIPTFC